MSVWRRKALALFPEWLEEIESYPNVYHLFFDLLPRTQEAHRAGDAKTLRRIHGFAEWCLHQNAKDIWNASAVCFYEHIFDERELWDEVVPWLSPAVVEHCSGLWEWRLGDKAAREAQARIRACKEHRYRETVFHTGEINDL